MEICCHRPCILLAPHEALAPYEAERCPVRCRDPNLRVISTKITASPAEASSPRTVLKVLKGKAGVRGPVRSLMTTSPQSLKKWASNQSSLKIAE